MPITRSKGRTPEAWSTDAEAGPSTSTPTPAPAHPRTEAPCIRHQMAPRSPSTSTDTEPRVPVAAESALHAGSSERMAARRTDEDSNQTLRPAESLRSHAAPSSVEDTSRQAQEIQEGRRTVRSGMTNRSNRNVLKAREEILKIKLQLAQLALQRAEDAAESDDYDEDGLSKNEYVRSWLEEAPEPQIENIEAVTGRGIDLPAPPPKGNSDTKNVNPPQIEAVTGRGIDLPAPPPKGNSDTKNVNPQRTEAVTGRGIDLPAPPTKGNSDTRNVNKQDEDPLKKKDVHQQGEDSLKPFITELTSAIAALVDRKPLDTAGSSPHPAVSKVIMTLPTFSGAHTEWLSFRAIYDTTRRYFNDVENTARLRKSLKGRALETVSSELIGHAKPDDIMKELELQFGRPDSIAQAETDKLRTLPRCSETPKDICMFASKIRSSVVTLQALKKEHYLINAELLRVLTEKLPNSLRVQWYRTYTEKYDSKPDLCGFSDFVTEYARYCSAFAPAENIVDGQPTRRVVQRTHTATENYPITTQYCKICEREGHYPSGCQKFLVGDADRRWELAKKHGLCFRCLRLRRQGHLCKSRKCEVGGCTATHNRLLHYEKKNRTQEADTEKREVVASSSMTAKPQAYLKIVPVQIVGPAGEASTFALLDDGSTISLIDEDIANAVGAEGSLDPFTIRAIGDTSIDMPKSRRIDVTMRSNEGKQVPLSARTVPGLHLTPQKVTEEDLRDCIHLQDIKEKLVYDIGVPKILIGQDNWHLLIASSIKRGPGHQPVASLTKLGWVLHGARSRTLGHSVQFVHQVSSTEENIEAQLKEYFALESLIINPRRPKTDPAGQAEEILEKSTKQLEDGHIETALLWKNTDFVMPDSYENATKRLAHIEKKLDRNTELKTRYTEQMNSLIEKGYAEEAPREITPGKTWYLPHFDVHNPMKPEKLRVVHDAAAKTKGMSLNDYLLTGPDLLQSLPGVMMRFRRHRVAVSADISEMFMQVRVRTEDRDALRYLWRGDRREGAPQEFRMKSIIFGAASSPCTAIFAKNWNARRYQRESPEAVEAIVENHYMDDYLDSFPSEEEATRVATKVRDIHREACFELRKWTSNSSEVKEYMEPSQDPTENVSIAGKGCEEKVLGLIWNPKDDELSFNLKLARLPEKLLEKTTPTKREALKIVMSLYDPLGLAAPVTVQAKKILQETWRYRTDWDEKLNDSLSKLWSSWIRHMEDLKSIRIPRCYPGFSQANSLQIHVFTDASETAYAAAVYWRATTPDGRVHVSLVTAKARVAPLKVISIPRLELQAAVMGSRIAAAVTEEHRVKPEATIYWTDSKTVLAWIRKGPRAYKPFVAHRLAAIEEYSKVDDWRWVPTKLNIADAATRDVPVDFNSHHPWYNGPSFLSEDSSLWPSEKPVVTEDTGEERTTTVTESRRAQRKIIEAIPDPNRFSRWERLLRATARVLQFIGLCRTAKKPVLYKRSAKSREKDPDWRKTSTKTTKSGSAAPRPAVSSRNIVLLTAEHTHGAEDLLVKAVQEDSFGADLLELHHGRGVARNSRLYSLPVEMNNGMITLRSRITATENVPEKTKRPPILDGDHRITQLYIDWTHRNLHHSGTELVINEIRQHYWVLRLRPTTKKIVQQCLQCRIRKARPPEPATGDLPRARLAHHQRPFTYTGLDYFGPLSVTVGRQHQKRYVALFTCLTSRAVHLEVAASLSADSAILALRRFAARRGCPTEIYSDNGTNMHGADKEMREAIGAEASRRGIAWRFITPSAPFMGGAWERLVRCVKNTLYTVLHDQHPHEEVLATLLCESEYIVNSRPLTHVSVNIDDDEAITPNHILFGGSARLPSLGEFSEADIDSRRHWRRAQILADLFWRRWVREYLPELQHRREPHGTGLNFAVGDPVLIADGQLPRNTWPRGRVVAVYPGADGQVRTVDVRTAAGVLRRPAKKLVPLPK